MILLRFAGVCSRASLIAASFASAPELQKNALPPKLRSRQQLGPASLGFRVPRIRHMNQLGRLLLNRFHHPRRTVPQQVAAPAGKEVEILPALVVPHQRAFAAHERSPGTECNSAPRTWRKARPFRDSSCWLRWPFVSYAVVQSTMRHEATISVPMPWFV